MFDQLIGLVAPHYCCNCGRIGLILCEDCKYNIISEKQALCLVCGRISKQSGLCSNCLMPYQRAWLVGQRSGALQKLINAYKFNNLRAAYQVLGDLVLAVLPDLPDGTVLVPVPTVASHVRQRGYDHIMLIARYVAKKRKVPIKMVVKRLTKTKQRQADAKQRQLQASRAFMVHQKLDSKKIYLLIDDVMTTGATLKYAALALKKAGAKQVWVMVIAR